MKILVGLLIPFLGTILGSSTVFLMRNTLNKKIEKILLGLGVTEIVVDVDGKCATFEDNGVDIAEIKTAIQEGGFDC